MTWWNVLVTQWLTDNSHSSCLNDLETIKLIDVIGRLIMWCAHWLKLNWPFQRKNFVGGLTVFLNGWLHVTASEAVRCLTDLVKCKSCFNLLTQLWTDINCYWPSDCLHDSGTLELMAIFVILIIWLSGYLFLMDWLWVLMAGWMPQKLLIVWLTWWNH